MANYDMPAQEALTGGAKKVEEYKDRIRAGEDAGRIMADLPPSFAKAIKEGLEGDRLKADEVRKRIGIPVDDTGKIDRNETTETKDPFNTFKVKNGETVEGVFWYEYRNQRAKEMKASGDLKWGKERIYFDIPLKDMVALRDIVMEISGREKIAVAFKHLDEAKTFASEKDGKETRFVTNFANQEDAARLMVALKKDPRYGALKSDRNMSYNGIRLDDIAEYASGYREQRGALGRIMKGSFGEDGKFSFVSEGGRIIKINRENYEDFRRQHDELRRKQEEAERKLKLLIGKTQ